MKTLIPLYIVMHVLISCRPEPDRPIPEQNHELFRPSILRVQKLQELPSCDEQKFGWILYVAEDESFRVCSEETWESLDFVDTSDKDEFDDSDNSDNLVEPLSKLSCKKFVTMAEAFSLGLNLSSYNIHYEVIEFPDFRMIGASVYAHEYSVAARASEIFGAQEQGFQDRSVHVQVDSVGNPSGGSWKFYMVGDLEASNPLKIAYLDSDLDEPIEMSLEFQDECQHLEF